MDNRPLYFAAVDAFLVLADQVGPDDWERPALGVWDVRSLVGHTSRAMTTVRDYLTKPAEQVARQTAAEYFAAALSHASADVHEGVAQRGVAEGQALGEDPPASLRALADQVRALLADAGNPVVTTFAGGMRLQDYLQTRVFELTVHSLDLADALGRSYAFPDEAVELSVEIIARVGVLTGQGPQVLRMLTGRGGSPFSLL